MAMTTTNDHPTYWSDFDSTTHIPTYYYHYNTFGSTSTYSDIGHGYTTPSFQKGDLVKIKDIEILLKDFSIRESQKRSLVKFKDVVLKVIDIYGNNIELDKNILGETYGNRVNKRALYKIEKKEIFLSRIKLNEELFQL